MVAIPERTKLLIFDVDGTLAYPFRAELLPGIAAWFTQMRRELETPPIMAVASNQGGVAYRHHLLEREREPDKAWKYADQAGTEQRIYSIAHWLGIAHVYISFAYQFPTGRWIETPLEAAGDPRWSRNWRKPNPGMLNQALIDVNVLPNQALMVGDEASDHRAAINAGIPFTFAKDFFSQPVTELAVV